jgi:hypothetical protein
MSRIRTIKPAFFRSLTIAELDLAARLTFIGLWTVVDDEGKAVDDARLVKAELWPLDDDHDAALVENDLAAIAALGLIEQYQVDGKRLLRVVNWSEHQVISHARPSSLPDPGGFPEDSGNDPGMVPEAAGSDPGEVPDDSVLKGRELNGIGTRAKRASIAPDDFAPFWDAYPRRNGRKLGKAATVKAWERLTQAERAEVMTAVVLYRAACDSGQTLAKDPQRFLTQRAWADWLEPASGDQSPSEPYDHDQIWTGGTHPAGERYNHDKVWVG